MLLSTVVTVAFRSLTVAGAVPECHPIAYVDESPASRFTFGVTTPRAPDFAKY